MFRIALIALALFCSPAQAGPDARQCRVERLVHARALCLEHVFQQRALRMAQLIQDTLSRLQAATAPELIRLERQYRSAQLNWHKELHGRCSTDHPDESVEFENCRLSGIAGREVQLAESLRRAAHDFGAPPEHRIPIPDEIEILVPLPNDFGVETRLPLSLSIHPD